MSRDLEPRLTAARPDLAAAALRGKVEAERFVDGERFTVVAEQADMRRGPRWIAPLDTQVLRGETLTVYEDKDGWAWAQADRDGYVGYVPMQALRAGVVAATHRVCVNRTYVYHATDTRQPPYAALPLEGRIAVEGRRNDFLKIEGHGFVFASHVAPEGKVAQDYVSVAEQALGAPYLWGGRSPQGIDCSGLVQLACAAAGRDVPRDADLQVCVGRPLEFDDGLGGLARGDLVFWKGHVGIMSDPLNLLHANAHHMAVVREPLAMVRDRIMSAGVPILAIRRFL